MPMQDKTGPAGAGPGTGRSLGSCGNGKSQGLGRGFGRAMCGRRFRRYQALSAEEKREILKQEKEDLKNELDMVEEEIVSLGK